MDLTARIGSVTLPNPVMPASGTAGYGTELGAYVDLASLGAVVTKSLAHFAWDGNPALRTHGTHGGMINSVGLQGPGIEEWKREQLPRLLATGARVVASIWGRSVDDYARAAEQLADCPDGVVAVEVNLSCPNTEAGGVLIAHDADASAATVAASEACGRPRWAKLSPEHRPRRRGRGGRPRRRRGSGDAGQHRARHGHRPSDRRVPPRLGCTGRRPLRPRHPPDRGPHRPRRPPSAPRSARSSASAASVAGDDAVELLRAGASAVQIGTANFDDPRTTARVLAEIAALLESIGAGSVAEIVGRAG